MLKDVHCFNIDPVAWKSLSHPAAGFGYQVVQRRSKWVGSVFHWMTNIICHKYVFFFQPVATLLNACINYIRSETGFLNKSLWFVFFPSLVCLSVPPLNNIQEMEEVKYFHAQLWAAHLFKVRISLISIFRTIFLIVTIKGFWHIFLKTHLFTVFCLHEFKYHFVNDKADPNTFLKNT